MMYTMYFLWTAIVWYSAVLNGFQPLFSLSILWSLAWWAYMHGSTYFDSSEFMFWLANTFHYYIINNMCFSVVYPYLLTEVDIQVIEGLLLLAHHWSCIFSERTIWAGQRNAEWILGGARESRGKWPWRS